MERKWFCVDVETKCDKKSDITVFNNIYRELRNTKDVEEFYDHFKNKNGIAEFFNDAPDDLRRVFAHKIQFHAKFYTLILDTFKNIYMKKENTKTPDSIISEIIDIFENEVGSVVKDCNQNVDDDDIVYVSLNLKDYAFTQLDLKCKIDEKRFRSFIKFNYISSYNRNKNIKIAGTTVDGVYASKLSVDDFIFEDLIFTEKTIGSTKEDPIVKINTEFAEFDTEGLKLNLHGIRSPEFNVISYNPNNHIKDVFIKMNFEFDPESDPKKSIEKYTTFSDFITNNYSLAIDSAFKCDNFKLILKSVRFNFIDVHIDNTFDAISSADQQFRDFMIKFLSTINPSIEAFNISKVKDEELISKDMRSYIISSDPLSSTELSRFEMNSTEEFKCPEQSLQK